MKRTIVLERRPFEGAEGHEALTIEVAYEKGGDNWFHGGTSPRGYFVRVLPREARGRSNAIHPGREIPA
jgi:hypothetical protein